MPLQFDSTPKIIISMDNMSAEKLKLQPIDQTVGTIDYEVNFSKQALDIYFNFENRKKIKTIMCKNNYKKLHSFLTDEFTIHNCLLYSIHYSLDKLSKKIIRSFYFNGKLNINKNKSEIFKFAIFYKKISLILLLIEAGSDIHVDEDYAFIQFCLLENIPVINLLVENGADIYARNSLALIQSALKNNIHTLSYLLQRMEKKKMESVQDYSATNYDLALLSATYAGNIEIVKLLLLAGANPLVNDSEAFIISADNGNNQLVKIFLENGVDANVRNGLALEKAARNGHYLVVKELVEFIDVTGNYSCDLSIDNSAALRFASFKGYFDIVKLLLDSIDSNGVYRCDPTAEDHDALHLAIKYGHRKIVELLESRI